jgi:hypothetical protein
MDKDQIIHSNELWVAALNSLNDFLDSRETRDIECRNAKQAHYEYLNTRMEEIRRWIDGEIEPTAIGSLADARNIFWDEPETPLQQKYCESIFQLFNFLRKQNIGVQKSSNMPLEPIR